MPATSGNVQCVGKLTSHGKRAFNARQITAKARSAHQANGPEATVANDMTRGGLPALAAAVMPVSVAGAPAPARQGHLLPRSLSALARPFRRRRKHGIPREALAPVPRC